MSEANAEEQQFAMMMTELSAAFQGNVSRGLANAGIDISAEDAPLEQLVSVAGDAFRQNAELAAAYADRFEARGETKLATICRDMQHRFEEQSSVFRMVEGGPPALEIILTLTSSTFHMLETQAHHIAFGATAEKIVKGLAKGLLISELIEKTVHGDVSAFIGVLGGALIGSAVAALADAVVVGLGITGGPLTAAVVVVVGVAAMVVGGSEIDSFVEELLEFDQEPGDVRSRAHRLISSMVGLVGGSELPTLGDYVAFGTNAADTLTPNYPASALNPGSVLIGDGGDDILLGGSWDDRLSGGADNDTLHGGYGADILLGGSGDDLLDGGMATDRLEGGAGFDTYSFSTDDLKNAGTRDTITDSDGSGRITFNGVDLSGTGIGFDNIRSNAIGTWDTANGEFRLLVVGAGTPTQSLLIVRKLADGRSGGQILVKNWRNGDLGISLPGYDEVGATLGLGEGDDLFGESGSNAGVDSIAAKGGNDGIEGGDSGDVLDGGAGADLIFGGSGNDRIMGGDGSDIILDGSELQNMRALRTDVDASGKSEQQRFDEEVAQRGASVIARGKNWFVYREDGAAATGDATQDSVYIIRTPDGSTYLDPETRGSGDDLIDAGAGSDRVFAGEGDDIVIGGLGNDSLNGGHDDDTLSGGEGDDTLVGDLPAGASPYVTLTALVSNSANKNGDDILDGGNGNDTLLGMGGNDTLYGGDGDDKLYGRNGQANGAADEGDTDADYLDGGEGADQLAGQDGDDVLLGGGGNDILFGDDEHAGTRYGNDHLEGGEGDDKLYGGGGNDYLSGGQGVDDLVGGEGQDTLSGGAGNDRLFGEGGNDGLVGGDGDDILIGDDGDDALLGEAGVDLLRGGDGDDAMSGGAGNDELQGGIGNDYLDGGDDDDKVFGEDGDDRISGGAGADQLVGEAGNDRIDGGVGNDRLWGGSGNDSLDGGEGADELYGDAGADRLVGGNGDDQLDGGADADVLNGNAGNDSLFGGDGDDLLRGDAGDDLLNGAMGADQLLGGEGADQAWGGEGNDSLSGDAGDDVLVGEEGDDTLTGGAGNDLLAGGVGNDCYRFETGFGQDRILANEEGEPGVDTLEFGAGIAAGDLSYQVIGRNLLIKVGGGGDAVLVEDYFGAASQVGLSFADGSTLSRSQLEQLLGSIVPVSGTNGDDLLEGTEGNDTLFGEDGSDRLFGNGGDDQISGGKGNDLLVGGSGNDLLQGDEGDDVYSFDAYFGTDTVVGLGDSGAGNDTIRFNFAFNGSNMSFGPTGEGSDDLVLVFNQSGTVSSLAIDGFFAPGSSHVIEFSDGVRLTASGSELVYNYQGGTGSDTYYGNNSGERFFGGAGDDNLYGRYGNDMLDGGAGNDVVDGGEDNDSLIGGDGDDALDGSSGNDVLTGGAGDDYLVGGSGDDRYRFERGFGRDTIENIRYGDKSSYTDTVEFGAGISPAEVTLRNRNGADLVLSFAGSDDELVIRNYFRDDGRSGSAVDAIRFADGTVWNVGTVLAMTLHSGDGDDSLYGYGSDDLLAGGLGDDDLHGGRGDDVIDGGAGNDLLDGGAGHDTYRFGRGSGSDTLVNVPIESSNEWDHAHYVALFRAASEGIDTVEFGAGIGEGDVTLKREGNDLVLAIAGSDDVLRVPHYFGWAPPADGGDTGSGPALARFAGADAGGGAYTGPEDIGRAVEFFRFGDGTTWDRERVQALLAAQRRGSEGDDEIHGDDGDADPGVLSGRGGNDRIYGNEGDDVIDGGAGNDVIDGGLFGIDFGAPYGNDLMKGGTGDDTYRYDWGNDVIDNSVGSGETAGYDVVEIDGYADDVSLERSGNDLLLRHRDHELNSVLTIRDYFLRPDQAIAEIRFADGGAWSQTDILDQVQGAGLLQGGDYSDTLAGRGGADTLDGGDGDDTLLGKSGNDRMIGGAGYDNLHGGSGNDILDGGAGDDYLSGGSGQNVYRFGNGDGYDQASDDGAAVLELKAGLTLADVIVQGRGNDPGVSVRIRGTGDVFVLDRDLAQLRFADGSSYDAAAIRALMLASATDGDDVLVGGNGGDVLEGGAGDDGLYGRAGDDVLDGGAGSDELDGGEGKDTYMFGRGYGRDALIDDDSDSVLRLGPGISAADVSLAGYNGDRGHVLRLLGSDDELRFEADRLAEIRFDDGTVWDRAQILAHMLIPSAGDDMLRGSAGADSLLGLDGDDRLFGGDGDDVIDGGVGNDYLSGQGGNDTYRFGRGSGEDYVHNGYEALAPGETSTIELGTDITVADVTVSLGSFGSGLVLRIAGTNDRLEISDYSWTGAEGSVPYTLAFADGTRWTAADVRARLLAGSDGDDAIAGLASGDTIDGGAGDDTVDGHGGNDHLLGGAGHDVLSGGDGDDRLDGGAGNDRIDGGLGNDVVVFGRGDGQDTIVYGESLSADVDVLELKAGVAVGDVSLHRAGRDLIVAIAGGDDRIVIQGHFDADGETVRALDRIRFADGTAWTTVEIANRLASSDEGLPFDAEEDEAGFALPRDYLPYKPVRVGSSDADVMHAVGIRTGISGGAGNDSLSAGGYNNGLFGGAGDDHLTASLYGSDLSGGSGWDRLFGNVGGDFLSGGSGNDLLDGGGGDDGLSGGMGADTLLGGQGDDGLYGDEGNDSLSGGGGDDGLGGGEGNDVLDGGQGDDSLLGGSGSDLFRFGRGSGRDRILAEARDAGLSPRNGDASTDVVVFSAGVTASDLRWLRQDGDLLISIVGTDDSLIIAGYFDAEGRRDPMSIDAFRFEDGSEWDYSQVVAQLSAGGQGDDRIRGFAGDDLLSGGDGNDLLSGQAGRDRLDGGAGNDLLAGDAGDDTLVGSSGDDSLFGGAGSDVYAFEAGFGRDRISDYVHEATPGDVDEIAFGASIAASDLHLSRIGDDLLIERIGSTDTLTVAAYFVGGAGGSRPNAVERIRFADGTVWGQDDVLSGLAPAPIASVADFRTGMTSSDCRVDGTLDEAPLAENGRYAQEVDPVARRTAAAIAFGGRLPALEQGVPGSARYIRPDESGLVEVRARPGHGIGSDAEAGGADRDRNVAALISAMASFAPQAGGLAEGGLDAGHSWKSVYELALAMPA
ncbi:calcium-binding protein [Lysobacter sp. CCNWLW3]|uniref:calcium-binding protein n=1 Tax=unclassified Lysobacter TaxID=2635362 RepID=UPI002FD68EDF